MVRLMVVVGARPNFIKIGPLMPAFEQGGIEAILVHTGQHYDYAMSQAFFQDLRLPEPSWHLSVGGGTHAVQTGKTMAQLEALLLNQSADAVLVVGDVNSTLAAALAAAKIGIPVIHLEAGLRSFDMSMPEEINRVVTDRLSAALLTPTVRACVNLQNEGAESDRIHFVGNIMAESLLRHEESVRSRLSCGDHKLDSGQYVLATVHRPENADCLESMQQILEGLNRCGMPVLLPCHPRVRDTISSIAQELHDCRIMAVPPAGYQDMLSLIADAAAVVTDSGGVQEESCMLHVPCITVRKNTERNETLELGANRLVPASADCIVEAIDDARDGSRDWNLPERWDQQVSQRVLGILQQGITPLNGQ